MREIKFRAWYPGECFQDGKSRMMSKVCISGEGKIMGLEGGWDYYGDDEKAIPMQYTGLKDKHGVEVYEGDIVPVRKNLLAQEGGRKWRTFNLAVDWDATHAEWHLAGQRSATGSRQIDRIDAYVSKYMEVLDNIYDNPDLLKAGDTQ
jgi:uncharacterized phage protein (TIGR01671 family)